MLKSLRFPCLPLLLGLFVLLSLTGCTQSPVGSSKRPFTMYFVPSIDAEQILTNAEVLQNYFSKHISQTLYQKDTGFHVKTAVPTSYVAVVEAMGTGKADFAVFTTFSYILARDIKKYPIETVLGVIRGENELTYKGQIIARADSGIKKLSDLKGKRFAYTDPASTSGFLLPARLFKKNNIELGKVIFGQKHDNVVTMVYQKQVDAGATFHSPPLEEIKNGKKTLVYRDARTRVLTQFPDAIDKIKIIAFTEDAPNDPLVIRKDLYPKDPEMTEKVKKAVIQAFLDFSKTEPGKQFFAMYNVTGIAPVGDSTYDGIRQLILENQLDLENLIRETR